MAPEGAKDGALHTFVDVLAGTGGPRSEPWLARALEPALAIGTSSIAADLGIYSATVMVSNISCCLKYYFPFCLEYKAGPIDTFLLHI